MKNNKIYKIVPSSITQEDNDLHSQKMIKEGKVFVLHWKEKQDITWNWHGLIDLQFVHDLLTDDQIKEFKPEQENIFENQLSQIRR